MARKLEEVSSGTVNDEKISYSLIKHHTAWTGAIFSVDEDSVDLAKGTPVIRQYLAHPGAVAIVALRGKAGYEEILLQRQYRHPVRHRLWEIPAGLCDVDGEEKVATAQRELREEADITANVWRELTTFYPSPGASNESITVFLATDLHDCEVPFERRDEEKDLVTAWMPLVDAVSAVLTGKIHNGTTIVAIMTVSKFLLLS